MTKATVKYIQTLAHKKGRTEQNVFFAEGPKLVAELINENNFVCKQIFCVAAYLDEFKQALNRTDIPEIEIIQDFELEKISVLQTPNKLLAVFQQKRVESPNKINKGLSILLDDIQDPGNLGTIIRIADWFGIKTIYCSPATADMYNPKVVQSTMASLGRVEVVYANTEVVVKLFNGLPILAAVLGGNSLKKQKSPETGLLIIGNESKGISDKLLQQATQKITIEKLGNAESLNAAVATGIILHTLLQ
jgi:RNA methyltransferase, TrmH family